jgi:3-oxoacyl-[acyl-carrier-protein] synthase II
VITGVAPITPIGIGKQTFWQNVLNRHSGIAPITSFDPSCLASQLGGEVRDFDLMAYLPPVKSKARELRKKTKIMARDIQMGCAASMIAVDDADLVTATRTSDPDQLSVSPEAMGVNIGSSLIAADLNELAFAMTKATGDDGHFSLRLWGQGPMNQLFPLWLLKYLPNLIACHITILHQAHGPCNTITSAEVAAHMAVGEAMRIIQRGTAEVMIAGGFECKINGIGMIRQILLNRLTGRNDLGPAACRPFDAARDGCVAAEGGGVVVLEHLEHALARGAPIYAELVGFAATHSAARSDDLQATGEAIAAAIGRALAEGALAREDVGLLIPHGEAAVQYDQMEADAIHDALGPVAGAVPVSPSKGAVGNMGAGNGAVDVIRAALAIRHKTAPPAVNCEQPDPKCRLNVLQQPTPMDARAAVVSGYSWAGQAAALVLRPIAP